MCEVGEGEMKGERRGRLKLLLHCAAGIRPCYSHRQWLTAEGREGGQKQQQIPAQSCPGGSGEGDPSTQRHNRTGES